VRKAGVCRCRSVKIVAPQAINGLCPRILVVDDEPSVLLFIEQVLADVGYYVTLAPNGRLALAQVRSREFDVVVIDLSLPDEDGMEVMRQIRSESRTRPFWLYRDTWLEMCQARPGRRGPQKLSRSQPRQKEFY